MKDFFFPVNISLWHKCIATEMVENKEKLCFMCNEGKYGKREEKHNSV